MSVICHTARHTWQNLFSYYTVVAFRASCVQFLVRPVINCDAKCVEILVSLSEQGFESS